MSNSLLTEGVGDLRLDRFCGREIYPITRAIWNLYPDDELGMMNLCLSIEAGHGTSLHEDTEALNAQPTWEVNVVEKDLAVASLISGASLAVPLGYDEDRGGHVTNFYYCEHEGSDENTIKILAVDGDRLLIRLEGETMDVNYYDGSKPSAKLFIETWFVHDAKTKRSMQ